MKYILVRYKVKKDKVKENEDALKKVFAYLEKTTPEGMRYTSLKLSDGVSFLALVQLEGETNPLTESDEFKIFQKGLMERMDGKPSQEVVEVVGSYKFFE